MPETNGELDKVCCEFAGLEPLNKVALMHSAKLKWVSPDPIYPPVSTDWAAAGRLMEALQERNVAFLISCKPWEDAPFRYSSHAGNNPKWRYASTGPRALCLAVAALAEAGKRESANG